MGQDWQVAEMKSILEWYNIRRHLDGIHVNSVYDALFWIVNLSYQVFNEEIYSIRTKTQNCKNIKQLFQVHTRQNICKIYTKIYA